MPTAEESAREGLPAGARWAAGASAAVPVVLAVLVGCALLQPRAVPPLIVALLVTLAVAAMPNGPAARVVRPALADIGPTTLALLAFAAYAAVSVAWSVGGPDFGRLGSLGKVLWLAGVAVTVRLAIAALAPADPATLARAVRWALAVVLVGALFVLIEVVWKSPLQRGFYNTVTVLRPEANKHMVFENGRVTLIGAYVMNRNVGALMLLLWPALLGLWALHRASIKVGRPSWLSLAGMIGLVAATTVAIMRSEHESSMIAFVVSTGVFILARLWLSAGRAVVAAGWVAAVLAMLPVALAAYGAGLQLDKRVPETGRARIVLWNFTAHEVVKRPLLGVGANATRTLDDFAKPTAEQKPGEPYGQRTGQHSHNVFVQTWYELGAIGAGLLLIAGLLLWRAIARLPAGSQPFALAAFTGAMVIGALTWGLWQEWYLSLFGLSALLTWATATYAGRLAGAEH